MTREMACGVSRRSFLAGAAGAGATGLAGCIKSRAEYDSGDSGDGNAGGPLSGEIGIAGSSTVYPLTRTMRVEFLDRHPDVRISVQSTGTGGGFGSYFCTGDRVINNASRGIKDSEREQCAENDIEPLEIRVATDALTVVVNNEADWVDCLTVDELAQIWGPDGADRWSDVREEWPDEEFELYGPASTSGTFDYFTEAIMGEEDAHRSDYSATEDDNTIVTGVKGSKYSMGYFGFAHYNGNSEAVKAVSIEDPETDAECVEPTLENAAEGRYTPLSRPLFIYVAKGALAQRHVAEFCRFYVRNVTSEELVADAVGYVPLTERQQAFQRGRLEAAIDSVTSDE
ncbi:PstS family phosphate ABC transporter substrate-binding protein [Halapricum hydrolyticum]|uniref:PstS family phosphate ABC transporter substrate-binding protein n=1 Tax=Halapricum hydrolyticum TaxID=2979991 RepID=A0AAE3LE64_9EURY|nr:PstS family phosphate ABC transporter substrate-binding protein [Halapricum hydrolyticum]MCU4716483.1 PstS family phosphate ABC transporter substrate-binding protein [Halapricum hydrolyticum]MCU4725912.1 PstS family phosphate ABC transporter substrate-binding protein [Halapricum hydrolyticum]